MDRVKYKRNERHGENGNQTQYLELGYDEDGIYKVSYRWDDYTGVISKDVEEKDGDGYHQIEYRELSNEIEMETFEDVDGNRVKEINKINGKFPNAQLI